MSGSRVTRLAALAGLLVLAVDLLINGHLSALFDIGFVLICVGAALAVRPARLLPSSACCRPCCSSG